MSGSVENLFPLGHAKTSSDSRIPRRTPPPLIFPDFCAILLVYEQSQHHYARQNPHDISGYSFQKGKKENK